MRSFLRWAGSKRRLFPQLLELWNRAKADRYVEPFMGSAGLFFQILPDRAVLGDLNDDLVETYRCVRDSPEVVFTHLGQWDVGKEEYYVVRQLRPETLKSEERAARFIYLNRYCFNGLYRTNLRGRFNVPYGGGRTGTTPNLPQLLRIREALQKVQLVSADFEVILDQVKPGDFVYMDPPYAVSSRRVFREYAANPFGVDDLERFTTAVRKIDELGAQFVISYAYSREALTHLAEWTTKKIFVQRNVGGFADRRRKAAELLIYNF